MKLKEELYRVVRTKKNTEAVYDLNGRTEGRGAYICKNSFECLKKAKKSRNFERSLSCKVKKNLYEIIEEAFLKK